MRELSYCVKDLSAADQAFFLEMSSYLSEYISDVKKDGTRIIFTIEAGREEAVLEKAGLLREMITAKLSASASEASQTTILEDYSDVPTINRETIFDSLISAGDILPGAAGSYAYSGLFLKVYEYFIRKIDRFSSFHFNRYPHSTLDVPALFPVEDYRKGGYFETFPHHIMFQTTLKNDISVLDAFAKNGWQDGLILEQMKPAGNVLRTAACAPVYPMLENQVLPPDEPSVFFVTGKCYRNEGRNINELSRLNEFLMKEYVFIGKADDVIAGIDEAKALWREWVQVFSLNCRVETANDSFFAGNYKKLKLFQMLGSSKNEFKLLIPHSKEYIAGSSANFHRTHFTKKYNIRSGDGPFYCHSTCFAFGIDRLAYGLLSQKGLDCDKWDKPTRREIEEYVHL
ncbi:aminoacyl--tRNA ligase-related protein [Desulfosporosinus youngiae]|uniref:Seryl-tRNA synthetase n=1 Tax=Desulfosporosinus youngiae DSM 17734 TaxID=768710 RepID=H5XU16_9FIRM|nr:aminoacyl--tRNA ligase-related protein [Desulfosporosinus youngiae]EHQ88974.1 seryl-tRNA synthetase [Desulfosporosinus youngiae DSM 17734]